MLEYKWESRLESGIEMYRTAVEPDSSLSWKMEKTYIFLRLFKPIGFEKNDM